MPGQILSLRLLRSAKPGRSFLAFLMNPHCPEESGLRRFSSRQFRPRGGGGRGRGRGGSESFGSRTLRRGEFQTGSLSGRGRGPKSLIGDEAELSDRVGDLKTSSIRLGLTSESEDSDRESSRDRGRGGRGGREGLSSSKSRRAGDFDVLRGGSNGGRSSRTLSSKGSKKFYNAFEEDDDDEEEDAFASKRREAGSQSPDGLSSRGGRYADSKFGHRREGGDSMRGGKASGRRAHQIVDSDDDEDDIDGISGFGDSEVEETDSDTEPPKGGASNRGSSKFKHQREGRDSMRGVKASGRQARQNVDSDDDDEDDVDGISGFGDCEAEETDSDTELLKGGASKTGLGTSDRKEVSSRSSIGKSDSYLSDTRFDQCSISPLSLKGIKEAGYERMTVVQEATLPVILKGKDVLAKAKTGTGKTVAFLLPAIEVIVKLPPPDRDNKRPPINVLIVCPTRELATQAATEAHTLLKFHPSLGVQVVIGGTRLALEQKRMQASPCQILVATPGRLKDHIENTPGFASRLMGIKVLVLDEADHLLDMGFRRDIEKIVAAVPKQRQTLLFSATVPKEVQQICHIALKRDYEFINTVEEGSVETHSQVKQMHLVAPLDEHFSLLYGILKEHIGEDADYKVLVFCTTAMVTKLVSELLSELKLNVREIHSRKPQSYRTRVSDEFRKSKGLILVTSDVSARGVDYPDVTLVVQVGLPSEREQYIHRLGRTGRKGKEGRGILLLAPWEEFFLSSIRDLPITKVPIPPLDPDTRKKVDRALSYIQMKNKESAYQAWLGYYNSSKNVGRDKVRLVQLANEFSRSMGLDNPPAIPRLVLGKMGLKNVPGLRSK